MPQVTISITENKVEFVGHFDEANGVRRFGPISADMPSINASFKSVSGFISFAYEQMMAEERDRSAKP